MLTIEVQTRTLGHQQAQEENTITLNLLEERITVADLLQRAVEEQVREALAGQLLAGETTQAAERHYLTAEEIAGQVQRGSVHMPDAVTVNVQTQVSKTLQAFEAHKYLVLIDNRRVKTLDEEILFTPTTKIVFLRLTPLVGG